MYSTGRSQPERGCPSLSIFLSSVLSCPILSYLVFGLDSCFFKCNPIILLRQRDFPDWSQVAKASGMEWGGYYEELAWDWEKMIDYYEEGKSHL